MRNWQRKTSFIQSSESCWLPHFHFHFKQGLIITDLEIVFVLVLVFGLFVLFCFLETGFVCVTGIDIM